MSPPAPAPTEVVAYCRRCGYSLRGLPTGNCPECGSPFDLSDRKTFGRRPPRSALRRWAWRASFLLILLALAAGSVPGWYAWHWRAEQRAVEALRELRGFVVVKRVEPVGLATHVPERWGYLHDHATEAVLRHRAGQRFDGIDLGSLPYLHRLEVPGCGLGDEALSGVRGMDGLELLDVSDNPLNGAGLARLTCRANLRSLYLGRTRLDDAGMAHVGGLTALKRLDIFETALTDAGMEHVAKLTSLQVLDMRHTAVTDAGLQPLQGLTSLRAIYLFGTKVTEHGKASLQAALPQAVIFD